ncbi:holin [Gordonia phage Button]|nr:holin [Gordonia phage Button]WKW84816.1 holin [Gordonia phage Jamzy]
MTRLRAYLVRLWHEEPVRTAIAPVILVLVAAGAAKVGVDPDIASIAGVVLLGVLGFTAQEIARAKVIPTRRAQAVVEDVLEDAVPQAQHAIEATVGSVSQSADAAIKVTVADIRRRLQGR